MGFLGIYNDQTITTLLNEVFIKPRIIEIAMNKIHGINNKDWVIYADSKNSINPIKPVKINHLILNKIFMFLKLFISQRVKKKKRQPKMSKISIVNFSSLLFLLHSGYLLM